MMSFGYKTVAQRAQTTGTSPSDNDPPCAETSVALRSRPRRYLGHLTQFARKLGAGIFQDIRARVPWYLSDWTNAWNYRVVPATTLIFFAKYASRRCAFLDT